MFCVVSFVYSYKKYTSLINGIRNRLAVKLFYSLGSPGRLPVRKLTEEGMLELF